MLVIPASHPDDMPIWLRLLLMKRGIPFASVTGFRIAATGAIAEVRTTGDLRYLHRRYDA